jgi:hypothetical protein
LGVSIQEIILWYQSFQFFCFWVDQPEISFLLAERPVQPEFPERQVQPEFPLLLAECPEQPEFFPLLAELPSQ